MADQREYKRKKSQKKALRRAQLEEEHEQDKNKWLDFNIKVGFNVNKEEISTFLLILNKLSGIPTVQILSGLRTVPIRRHLQKCPDIFGMGQSWPPVFLFPLKIEFPFHIKTYLTPPSF